jgi:hypothetical protein
MTQDQPQTFLFGNQRWRAENLTSWYTIYKLKQLNGMAP